MEEFIAVPQFPHEIKVSDIEGREMSLAEHAGKVLFIVNVASKCGFTSHYTGLQELHERYHKRGLVVCGFPCNDFGGQEPGTEDEVREFCTLNYGVTFPMFAKVHVRGKKMHPLFSQLVKHPRHGGRVKWNFSKFLIDRKGELQDRFAPFTKPTASRVTKVIERLLDQNPETT